MLLFHLLETFDRVLLGLVVNGFVIRAAHEEPIAIRVTLCLRELWAPARRTSFLPDNVRGFADHGGFVGILVERQFASAGWKRAAVTRSPPEHFEIAFLHGQTRIG
jgi:hypothetical protein